MRKLASRFYVAALVYGSKTNAFHYSIITQSLNYTEINSRQNVTFSKEKSMNLSVTESYVLLCNKK